MYFEPIEITTATTGHVSEYSGQPVKQDITGSEDDYPRATIQDKQQRTMIGAYRGDHDGLPPKKGFAIQIGSEVFRMSGASIMSDGELVMRREISSWLTRLEHPRTFPSSLRNRLVILGMGMGV